MWVLGVETELRWSTELYTLQVVEPPNPVTWWEAETFKNGPVRFESGFDAGCPVEAVNRQHH